jgi:plastocyanin
MRKLSLLALAAVLVSALVLPGTGTAGQRPTRTVEIGDDFFKPRSIRVKKGTRVIFKWTGINRHNARGMEGQRFTTGLRGRTSGQKGVTINAARGTRIEYICEFHPDVMIGVIRVSRRR